MKINNQTILNQNITLAYQELELQAIDMNQLKGLIDLPMQQMVINADRVVLTYTRQPVTIQVGDKRVQILLQQRSPDVGTATLCEYALGCHRRFHENILAAYGFNFDVEVNFADGNTHNKIAQWFPPDSQKLETALGGTQMFYALTPRLAFRQGQKLCELLLQASDPQCVRVLYNAHFEHEGLTLPPQEELETSYRQEYEQLLHTIIKLFAD